MHKYTSLLVFFVLGAFGIAYAFLRMLPPTDLETQRTISQSLQGTVGLLFSSITLIILILDRSRESKEKLEVSRRTNDNQAIQWVLSAIETSEKYVEQIQAPNSEFSGIKEVSEHIRGIKEKIDNNQLIKYGPIEAQIHAILLEFRIAIYSLSSKRVSDPVNYNIIKIRANLFDHLVLRKITALYINIFKKNNSSYFDESFADLCYLMSDMNEELYAALKDK